MQSRTSFFNATLFRKNLSRFWPLWGFASFVGAIFPLALMVQMIRYGGWDGNNSVTVLSTKEMFYQVLAYGVPIICCIYAAMCAVAVWSYLYNNRSVSMMHALPVRRSGLFFTSYLSGMVMMAIPFAVTGVLAVIVTALYGGFTLTGTVVTILGVIGNAFCFFGIATLCAHLVGSAVMLPLIYALVNFLAVLLDWMVHMLAQGFVMGLGGSLYSGAVEHFSPVVFLVDRVRCITNGHEVRVADTWGGEYTDWVLDSVTLENGWLIAVYAAVGLALTILAYLLYRTRHSETAGDVVAMGFMKPTFRYGCAVFAAILGGRLLYAILWEELVNTDTVVVVPMIVCMAVAGLIGYYGASMLLEKTARVFRRKTLPGAIGVLLGCVLLCVCLSLDAFHIEDRVPTVGEVDYVQIYTAESNYYLYAGEDNETIEQVRALHSRIVEEKDYIYGEGRDRIYGDTPNDNELAVNASVELTYHLKNGRMLNRWYYVPMTESRLTQVGTYDYMLDQLVNSETMRQKRIRWNDSRFVFRNGEVNLEENGQYFGLDEATAARILDAVAKDAANDGWGKYDWFHAWNDADTYAVNVNVYFTMLDKNGREEHYDDVWIALRPTMKETIAVLTDLGYITEENLVTRGELYPWEYVEDYDAFYEKYGMDPYDYYQEHVEPATTEAVVCAG